MAFIRVIALALALATSSRSLRPSESVRNQYVAQDRPEQLTEATDQPSEVHMSLINNSTNGSKQVTAAPDLQVGCGDGFIHEKLHERSEEDKNRVHSKKAEKRKRRSYTPWSGGQVVYSVPYQSISVWRPPIYQLQRPYFIPIYGSPGRVPIYYPPQPLYINPGAPKDNPRKPPFRGPTYLPPTTPKMEIKDRFNGGDNSVDKVIWDNVDDNEKVTPRPPIRPTTAVVPTRRTRPPGVPKTPPLIHNPTDPQAVPVEDNRVTTSRPSQALPPAVNEPSRCVWAIISCCSSTNEVINDCFEQRGCPGPFWDANPCDSDWARAAIAAALNYYNRK